MLSNLAILNHYCSQFAVEWFWYCYLGRWQRNTIWFVCCNYSLGRAILRSWCCWIRNWTSDWNVTSLRLWITNRCDRRRYCQDWSTSISVGDVSASSLIMRWGLPLKCDRKKPKLARSSPTSPDFIYNLQCDRPAIFLEKWPTENNFKLLYI